MSYPAPARFALLLPCAGLILATLAWAGNAVIGRGLRQAYDPLELTFYRWSVACICLYVFGARSIHAEFGQVRRNLGRILLGGMCGMAGYHLLQYFALSRMSASEVSVIVGLTPLVVTLVRLVSSRTWPTWPMALGVGMGVCGVVLVCSRNGFAARHDELHWVGVGAAVAAMLCWSLYSIRSPRCEGMSWLSTMFFMSLASSLVLLPFYVFDILVHGTPRPDLTLCMQILYLGVPASAAAYGLYNFGIQRVGAVRAAQFNCLIPAFASALAAIFLGESITKTQAYGLVLVVISLNLVLMAKSANPQK